MTIPTQTINPPLQRPTVDVSGKVIYQAGPWGSKYPARKISADIVVTDTTGATAFAGNSLGDSNGKFRVQSGFITSAFSRVTLKVHEDFTGQNFDVILYPGLIAPNQGLQDIGEIVFPFEPEHSELAVINGRGLKDAQDIAKTFAAILRSTDKRVSADLFSEVRGTESISAAQLADDRFPRVISKDGKVYKNPVPLGTQQERWSARKEDERFIRESLKQFKPVPILTPAQVLLKTLYMASFAKDFPQRVVKEIYVHKIVPGNAGASVVDSITAILAHFSLVKIADLETGNILRRIVNALQKAGKTSFHFDTVMEEAAADMATACAIIFLAGFMAKNNAEPRITFNYWHQFMGNGVPEARPYVKISISVGK